MGNEAEDKKKLVLSLLAVVVLILMVVGVSYAVFTYSGRGQQENTVSTGTVIFEYKEDSNGIMITDAQPTSDEDGKRISSNGTNIAQGYFDFSVSATMSTSTPINYEIYGIETSPELNKLDSDYVKIYLTDNSENSDTPVTGYDSVVPTYNSLPASTSEPTIGKKLYDGTFNYSDSKKFRLRMWIAQNYPQNQIENSQTFSMKVNVRATGS